MDTQNKKFHPLYALSIAYVVIVYLFPVLFYALNPASEIENPQPSDYSRFSASQIVPLILPAFMGLFNLVAVIACRDQVTRDQLLHCAILIKYSLIPFFIAGGLCIALTWLLTFSPVVIMIFIGPVVVAIFSVLGYIAMLGSAPYAIGYLIRCKQEKVHHPLLLTAGGIMQFIFVADTISLMILALKEKKCIKATVILAALLALAIQVIGGLVIYGIVRIALKS